MTCGEGFADLRFEGPMDRRDFLTALLATPGLLVAQSEGAVTVAPAPPPGEPAQAVTLTFGDLVITSGAQSTYEHTGRTPCCPHTGRLLGRGEATVKATRFVAPKETWDELSARYGAGDRAGRNPPVVVGLGGRELLVLDYAVLTDFTVTWMAADKGAAVGSVGLLGVWRAMHEMLDEYYRAEAAKAAELRALEPVRGPHDREFDWLEFDDAVDFE